MRQENADAPGLLVERDYQRWDQLLRAHFARFFVEMIWLASICLGATMILAVVIVFALRS